MLDFYASRTFLKSGDRGTRTRESLCENSVDTCFSALVPTKWELCGNHVRTVFGQRVSAPQYIIEESIDQFIDMLSLIREGMLIYRFQSVRRGPAAALHRVLVRDTKHQHNGGIQMSKAYKKIILQKNVLQLRYIRIMNSSVKA